MSVQREEVGSRECRIYIDHLDNPDGLVWAVDMRPLLSRARRRYVRASSVSVQGANVVTTFRPGRRQPRAWLQVFGSVTIVSHDTGAVVVIIRR